MKSIIEQMIGLTK